MKSRFYVVDSYKYPDTDLTIVDICLMDEGMVDKRLEFRGDDERINDLLKSTDLDWLPQIPKCSNIGVIEIDEDDNFKFLSRDEINKLLEKAKLDLISELYNNHDISMFDMRLSSIVCRNIALGKISVKDGALENLKELNNHTIFND